jgi:hypothetical protein
MHLNIDLLMSNHVLFFVGALLAIPCLASNGNMAGSGT